MDVNAHDEDFITTTTETDAHCPYPHYIIPATTAGSSTVDLESIPTGGTTPAEGEQLVQI